MRSAQSLADDSRQPQPQRLASWYAQGLSEGIGDRLLMFDNTGAPCLELLRFRAELVGVPGFENALRDRVELLSQFRHAAFPTVRAVSHLGSGNGLTLVSTYTAGKRLSEVLPGLREPAFVMWLVRQLIPALATLQNQGRGVVHGALTPDRIVLTPEGQLVIVEHVLGAALEHLQLSQRQLWSRFGIAATPTAVASRLDCRTDMIQLGLIALALLLGRGITLDEYPDGLGELLEGLAASADRPLPSPLRTWLERALQVGSRPFESARDAYNALSELPGDGTHRGPELASGNLAKVSDVVDEEQPVVLKRPRVEWKATDKEAAEFRSDHESPSLPVRRETDSPERKRRVEGPTRGPLGLELNSRVQDREVIAADLLNEGRFSAAQLVGGIGPARWLMGALVLFAVCESAFIVYLLYLRAPAAAQLGSAIAIESPQPGAQVVVDGQVVGTTPFQLRVGPETRSIRIVSDDGAAALELPPAISTQTPRPPAEVRPRDQTPAVPVRTGGIRVVSPIDIQMLEGDRVLGSSSEGPIVMTAGRHDLELVNSVLGFRARQVVEVKPGQIVSLPVSRPNGRISVNAVPWAEVWIDGSAQGETPLANLSVPIGEHEVVFRHPTLGEQRRTAVVRFDALARVSADLR